jgi:hypothetical protein
VLTTRTRRTGRAPRVLLLAVPALAAALLLARQPAIGAVADACPAGPALPASADTCVNADVAPTLMVTAPSFLPFGSVAVGSTAKAAADVYVESNNPGGYYFGATRTGFTNGDLPLAVEPVAPPDPGQQLDLAAGSDTAIPIGSYVTIGQRSASMTSADLGDRWPMNLVLGPIPNTAAGSHSATVTFTAVAF